MKKAPATLNEKEVTLSSLWLVIPCFNEQERLQIETIASAVDNRPGLGLCLVDDGSRDRTYDLISSLVERFPDRIVALRLSENMGKAEAVRQGMLHVLNSKDAETVGYWDADLAAPLDQLEEFDRAAGRANEWYALLGCRHKRLGTIIERRGYRHYLGRVFATLVSTMLRLPVYDTQCGAKLFSRSAAARIFDAPFCSRWCFDVEILARLKKDYGTQAVLELVAEVPLLRWYDVCGSRLGLLDLPRMLLDLVRIKNKYDL